MFGLKFEAGFNQFSEETSFFVKYCHNFSPFLRVAYLVALIKEDQSSGRKITRMFHGKVPVSVFLHDEWNM